jgi:hypothetical protein
MKKIYSILVLLLISHKILFAQYDLPIYEPFKITLGRLAGQNTWTGNTTSASVGAQVVNNPLTYSGLNVTASSSAIIYGNQTSGGTQALGFASQTSTVYTSFLMQVSSFGVLAANTRYNFGFGSTTTGGTFAGCMIVVPNTDGTTFELGFNGTNAQPLPVNTTAQSFALNTTIMVVMAYTPGASGAGKVSAWINPSSTTFGSATVPAATFSDVIGGTISTVSSVFIRSGSATNPMYFDELRVGTSWAQVTTHNVVLPVKLSDFSSTSKGNLTTLSWLSHTETDFDKYIVMSSKNGIQFNEIGTVKGLGNNTQYNFNYTHYGDVYFKLKMLDLNGSYVFSDIIHARGKYLKVQTGPNPFSDHLEILGMPSGNNKVILYAIDGTILYNQIINNSNASLSLVTVPAGQYVLNITNEESLVHSGVYIKK